MGLNNLLNSTYIPQFDEWSNKYGYDNLANALTQGLNLGNKDIAEWQRLNNIRIPQTNADIGLAQAGLFNLPNEPQANNQPVFEMGLNKQPGVLDNMLMGYRDNYNNPIGQTSLPAQKNWATRIGEGLGTIGRFVDSPLGRGLIGAGLMAAVGGNPAYAIGTGLTAGVGRQNAMTADKLYRNQLKQYGYTDEDLADIKGNITSDIYKNLTTNIYRNKQLEAKLAIANAKDNSTKAKMILDGYKNGSLSEADVIQSLATYGITLNDLQESNETKKTNSQVELNQAKTEKTKAETGQVGKPKVTINIKKGGTKSVIEHVGGNSAQQERPTKKTSQGSGLKFVGVRNK